MADAQRLASASVTEPVWVSVLMTAFNAERWLREAMDSILAQTHPCFELVAVDDGSTDATLSILEAYAARDERVRVITHENWGQVPSLNHALQYVSHHWIARMDADDVMMPNRLERQLAFLRENPDVAVAASFSLYIDARSREVGKYATALRDKAALDRLVARKRMVGGFHHSGVMMRRDIVNELGGYRPEFAPAEDFDLWNRVVHSGQVVLVQPEYLMKYRLYGGSLSVTQVSEQAMRFRWIAECVRRRLSGTPELSYEDYIEFERSAPLLVRLNRKREVTGRTLFMQARSSYSERRQLLASAQLTAAVMLAPVMALGKVWARKLGR